MSIYYKRRILFFILYIILLQLPVMTYSQPGSPLSLSLNYIPAKNESTPFFLNFNLSINFPAYKDSLITGLIGTNFKYYRFNFQNDSLDIHNLYSWSVPITFLYKTSEIRYFAMMFEPSLSSDFKDISSSDLRYNLAMFYVKKKDLNSSFGIGIAISKRFSGFQIAPFYLINMRFRNKWILSGNIPFKSKLAYEINGKKKVGISFGANSNSFRLSEKDNNNYMDYQAIEVSLFYHQPVLKHFKWNINFGMQSTPTEVYSKNQTFPLSLFLISRKKSGNSLESFKNKGMLLFQVNFSYAPFEKYSSLKFSKINKKKIHCRY